MSKLKFSIVVPSYNQASFLRATLQSLLDQNDPDLEILACDGGSTDGSVDILQEYSARIQWTSRRDFGQTHAINQGLRRASGDIVAYLNSDDVYYPGCLERVRAHFAAHPECLFLYGDAHHLHEDGSVMEPYYTEPWNYDRLKEICFLCQPAVFWRADALERFGYFDDTLNYAMDYDYWLRVGCEVPFHYLRGEFLAGSRIHDDGKTLSQRVQVHREILRVVMRHSEPGPSWVRWLRHLTHYRTVQDTAKVVQGKSYSLSQPEIFVRNMLAYSVEFGVVLDAATLRELVAMLGGSS